MPFPTDDIMLLDNDPQHSWGKRPSTAGIVLHTTEGAGPTRDAAVATAKWQNTVPGSYNFIIYDVNSPGAKGGALLTIPYDEACGGLNPGGGFWAPEPWLKDALPPKAFADPTMYHIQFSFSGKAARLAAGDYPRNMLVTAARLAIWAEERYGHELVISGHEDWQSNRSDPGAGIVRKVRDIIEDLKGQVPQIPDPVIDYKPLYEAEVAKNAQLRAALRTSRSQTSAARAETAALQGKISAAQAALE